MKKIAILATLIVLVSCNYHIEKRRYFKGFYVERAAKQIHSNPNSAISTTTLQIPANDLAMLEPTDINLCALSSATTLQKVSQIHAVTTFKTQNIAKLKVNRNSHASRQRTFLSQGKKQESTNNKQLFSLAALIGLSMSAFAYKFRKQFSKLSNWAVKNKYKTIAILAALQFISAGTAMHLGSDLYDMGYNFSDSTTYWFGGMLLLATIASIKLSLKKSIETFKTFFTKKFLHITIAVCSMMSFIHVGNHIGRETNNHSFASYVINKHVKKDISTKKITKSELSTTPVSKSAEIGRSFYTFLQVLGLILYGLVMLTLVCAVWCWAGMQTGFGPGLLAALATIALVTIFVMLIIGAKNAKYRRFPPKQKDVSPEK